MMHMKDYFLENTIKSLMFWIVGLLALSLAFGVFNISSLGSFPSVPPAQWQAVFLTNNQVYFGKLVNYDNTYVTLTDVYYLRTASDLDQSGGTSLNLIKLGGELHGPEDVMYIPKANVLFWENMKDSSQVVQTIMSASPQK